VAVALVGGVEHHQRVEQGQHGTPVPKHSSQAGIGPPARPHQPKQPWDDENGGLIDQGYGSLERRVRQVAPRQTLWSSRTCIRTQRIIRLE
jgi:hypothetical protein